MRPVISSTGSRALISVRQLRANVLVSTPRRLFPPFDYVTMAAMTTKNPFPGMNPFFEQRWQDAHTRLIAYLCDALQERLPGGLVAGAEEELVAIGAEVEPAKFRPDISVKKPWEDPSAGGVAGPYFRMRFA